MDGLTIERVGPDLARVYSRTGFESFSERGPQFVPVIEALVRSRRRWLRAFLGRIDGEPAATGILFDLRPIGGLGNGETLRPAFRGRGLRRRSSRTGSVTDGNAATACSSARREPGVRAQHGERGWRKT